jgi:hypothetical protein
MCAEEAGAVVKVTVGGHANEGGTGPRLCERGGEESGPPWGGVSLGHDGDAVGLVCPGFEEGRLDEREWREEQAALGAKGLAPRAESVGPAVLGQCVDPGGCEFGVVGIKTGTLSVGGGGE